MCTGENCKWDTVVNMNNLLPHIQPRISETKIWMWSSSDLLEEMIILTCPPPQVSQSSGPATEQQPWSEHRSTAVFKDISKRKMHELEQRGLLLNNTMQSGVVTVCKLCWSHRPESEILDKTSHHIRLRVAKDPIWKLTVMRSASGVSNATVLLQLAALLLVSECGLLNLWVTPVT